FTGLGTTTFSTFLGAGFFAIIFFAGLTTFLRAFFALTFLATAGLLFLETSFLVGVFLALVVAFLAAGFDALPTVFLLFLPVTLPFFIAFFLTAILLIYVSLLAISYLQLL